MTGNQPPQHPGGRFEQVGGVFERPGEGAGGTCLNPDQRSGSAVPGHHRDIPTVEGEGDGPPHAIPRPTGQFRHPSVRRLRAKQVERAGGSHHIAGPVAGHVLARFIPENHRVTDIESSHHYWNTRMFIAHPLAFAFYYHQAASTMLVAFVKILQIVVRKHTKNLAPPECPYHSSPGQLPTDSPQRCLEWGMYDSLML